MKRNITILLLLSFFLVSCVMNKLNDDPRQIILSPDVPGDNIVIEVLKGDSWSNQIKGGPFIFNVLPQIVIWTEDDRGNLLDTLFITGADYKKMRHAGKDKLGAAFYTLSFPYWSGQVERSGGQLPSKDNPYPDSITSATPMSDFTLETMLPAGSNPEFLYLSINQSGDINEFYTEDKTDWVGQPSLIYRANIRDLYDKKYAIMEVIGSGGLSQGISGIETDLTQFDTALDQIHSLRIIIE